MRAVAIVLALTCSCTAAQSRHAHTAGGVALASSLVAMLTFIAAAEVVPSHEDDFMRAGVVFVPPALVGALHYAATDGLDDRVSPSTASDRAYDTAFELAREAKHAARRNDCAEVQAIEPRVRELDLRVYQRFLHEEIIRRCLVTSDPQP